ncbi:MAG: glycosyltransferase [Syntrophotaleaceae bacterium]
MISVIIPSYNSENTIELCLQSLINQSWDVEYEIILVDSSVDRTPEIVAACTFERFTYIHLNKKTDPGTARNIGIGRAKGDIFAFIDSDCIAAPDWLERIALAHESSFKVVGGVVYSANDEKDLVALAGYLAEFREFLPGQQSRTVGHIPTCNISYKRSVFEDHGLFDGRYYPQEDLVFNYHLVCKGEKILLDPSIGVSHHHRSSFSGFLAHQQRIGKITSRVLRIVDLEGSFIVKNPYLGVLFLPLLPLVKFAKTVGVFLRRRPGLIIRRPLALIYLCIGLTYWIRGFAQGMYEKPLH